MPSPMSPDEIVTAFDRAAGSIARQGSRYCNYAIPADDLKQEALMGALAAAPGFDESRFSFAGWIFHKMRFAVHDAIRREVHKKNISERPSICDIDRLSNGKTGHPAVLVDPWPAIHEQADLANLRQFASARTLAVLDARLQGIPQADIARSIGCANSRVSQLEMEAVAAMRAGAGILPVSRSAQMWALRTAKAKSASA